VGVSPPTRWSLGSDFFVTDYVSLSRRGLGRGNLYGFLDLLPKEAGFVRYACRVLQALKPGKQTVSKANVVGRRLAFELPKALEQFQRNVRESILTERVIGFLYLVLTNKVDEDGGTYFQYVGLVVGTFSHVCTLCEWSKTTEFRSVRFGNLSLTYGSTKKKSSDSTKKCTKNIW